MVAGLSILAPVGLSMLFGFGFMANEWSHGGVSEAVGLGHHHMLDNGGYHCVDHGDMTHAQHHRSHMHNASTPMPHEGCPGGGSMHGRGMTYQTMPRRQEA